jgi:hypothetical protein
MLSEANKMAKVDELYAQLKEKKEATEGAAKGIEDAKAIAAGLEAKLKEDSKAVKDLQPQLHEALEAEIKSRRAALSEAAKALKANDYKTAHDLLKFGKVEQPEEQQPESDVTDLCIIMDSSGSIDSELYNELVQGAVDAFTVVPEGGKYAAVNFSDETISSGWHDKPCKTYELLRKQQLGGTRFDPYKVK